MSRTSQKNDSESVLATPGVPHSLTWNDVTLKQVLIAVGLILLFLLILWLMMGRALGVQGRKQDNFSSATHTPSGGSYFGCRSPNKAALMPADLVAMFPNQESIYEYSLEKGLILCRMRCPKCRMGNLVLPEPSKNVLFLGQRVCSECNAKFPVTENTVFSWNPQPPPLVVLLAMWAWSHKKTIIQARYEMEGSLGEAPSLETIESLYMMFKTVSERFLKLCPNNTTEEHYTMLHRFECCGDFILGGRKDIVEMYMDYVLPSGEAIFLAKERCSDRAMMRSTSRINPETVEAFVSQFIRQGSVVILPPVGSQSDLSLIDGYEFLTFSPGEQSRSAAARDGQAVRVNLDSVLSMWGQLVPRMTNDVSDELHLAIYLVQATWFKYFGCEAGYDPLVTLTEQCANAFSQWGSVSAAAASPLPLAADSAVTTGGDGGDVSPTAAAAAVAMRQRMMTDYGICDLSEESFDGPFAHQHVRHLNKNKTRSYFNEIDCQLDLADRGFQVRQQHQQSALRPSQPGNDREHDQRKQQLQHDVEVRRQQQDSRDSTTCPTLPDSYSGGGRQQIPSPDGDPRRDRIVYDEDAADDEDDDDSLLMAGSGQLSPSGPASPLGDGGGGRRFVDHQRSLGTWGFSGKDGKYVDSVPSSSSAGS